MCCFCIVMKLLIFKILLLGLITASRYDYGYHPSAEEFDNLLRETQRTWTHSFLKAERDRVFTKPADYTKAEARHFVPKFQYDNKATKKFEQNPLSTQQHFKPLQNIASSVKFNYFSNEIPKPIVAAPLKSQPTWTTTTKDTKPLAKPQVFNSHKNSLHNFRTNKTQAELPIYFTNPATGIVYAITELGKTTQNLTKSNGTIPIFITKEKYERDIHQLKNIYEQKCQSLRFVTTPEPPIIKLQKPLATILPITSSKFSPKTPAPVVVKTELIVKDKQPSSTTTRPLRKTKTKSKPKPKRKIKKQKPPGHKALSTTKRPVLASQPEGPAIIMGTKTLIRKPSKNTENLATQLEKPNFDIFSGLSESKLEPGTVQPNFSTNIHRLYKRSVKQDLISRLRAENLKKNNTNFLKNFNDTETPIFTKSFKPTYTRETNYAIKLFLDFVNKYLIKINLYKSNNRNKIMKLSNEYFRNASTKSIRNMQNLLKYNSGFKLRNKQNKNNKYLLNIPSASKDTLTAAAAEDFLFNSNSKSPKHHLNKRSVNYLTKNSSTLAKSIKKSENNPNIFFNAMQEKNNTDKTFKTNNQQASNTKTNTEPSKKNSTKTTQNLTTKLHGSKRETVKFRRKRKRLSKLKPMQRTAKPGIKKQKQKHNKKQMRKKYQGKQQGSDYFFDLDEDYDDDDDEEYEDDDDDDADDYDEEDEEEDVEDFQDYQNHNEIVAYDDVTVDIPNTSEAGLSTESLRENATQETSSSPDKEIKNSLTDYDYQEQIDLKTKPIYVKKRFRRRPPQLKKDKDYEDDEDGDDDDDGNSISSNLGGFFRMMLYPVQVIMSSVMDVLSSKDAEEEENKPNFNPYTQYTSYHKTLKEHSSDDYDEDYDAGGESSSSSISDWFSSWFSFNRRNKKIGTTTIAPIKAKPTKSSSWLPSWLSFGANDRISTEAASNEEYDEYDKWFASWFGETKPNPRKRTTTTTSTTTQIPHVPILTIVDPMKNPQNWIGILAHHIINHTSTSTANPIKDVWNRVTSTTTENPEIPRKISYDKYQIWRLKPQDDSQFKALEEYKKSEEGIKLQWLKGPSLRGLTDVLVPPKMLVDFQASLTFELIDHEVLIFDVGKAIAYEKSKENYFFTTTQKPKRHQNKNNNIMTNMSWHKYYEYDDIIKHLETMRMRFPHLVDLIHIGRSYEGRPLIVMKIESKEAAAVNSDHYPAHQRNKLRHRKRIGLANAVFIEAGVHGMEWISPATATWIINELLRIMKKNVTDEQSFIRNTTWYIMPVLNPDGYVYSHEFDRFWKKSRSRHVSRPSGIISSAMTWLQKKRAKERVCFGVDLDRNWHYQWGRRGSSKSACNEFYAGPTPFSEPETKALSEFLMDYRAQIKLFISMQSYGQIISYPYKANTTYDSERLDDLLDVAMVGTDGLRMKGSKSRYKIDSSNDLIENRSGTSDAFAAYEAGIPFSYTLQLADNGVHGYLLPSASIESTAKDSFEIITGMLNYI